MAKKLTFNRMVIGGFASVLMLLSLLSGGKSESKISTKIVTPQQEQLTSRSKTTGTFTRNFIYATKKYDDAIIHEEGNNLVITYTRKLETDPAFTRDRSGVRIVEKTIKINTSDGAYFESTNKDNSYKVKTNELPRLESFYDNRVTIKTVDGQRIVRLDVYDKDLDKYYNDAFVVQYSKPSDSIILDTSARTASKSTPAATLQAFLIS